MAKQTKPLGVLALAVIGAAAALGVHFEGVRHNTYRDVGGIPTICYGHTQGVKAGDTATDDQCKAWLSDEMADALATVDRCLPSLPFGPRVAFTDAVYNAGHKIVCGSTLQRKALAGDMPGACAELDRWVYAGGKIQPGLVKRRALERQICEG